MFGIHKLEGIDTGAAKSDRLWRKTRTPKSWSSWAMTSAVANRRVPPRAIGLRSN